LGDWQKALDYANKALLIFQTIGARQFEASALSSIGLCYAELHDKQKALDYYNRALPIYRAAGSRLGEAATLHGIGTVYDDLGDTQKAFDYYGQALSIYRATGDRRSEMRTLYWVARLERNRGSFNEARKAIEASLVLIESLRIKITSPELRASFMVDAQTDYEFYIDLLMRLSKQNHNQEYVASALSASERGRARSLLEILREARADIRQGVAPELLERERVLQQ
jgi:tetratricopeptide (TPR) repeat protein